MHSSIIIFVTAYVKPEYVTGKDVLEVGSFNVNGTIRPIIEDLQPASYLATDMMSGEGVDVVCDAKNLTPDSADLVLSFEMLEHAEDWRSAMLGMHIALRKNGYIVLSARGPGFPYHGYPYDYNRFTVADMESILGALGMDIIYCGLDEDRGAPGVFAVASKMRAPNISKLASITVQDAPGPISSADLTDQRLGTEVVFLGK